MDQEKRQLRKLKREIKKTGNKRRRAHGKRELVDNPEEAHHDSFDFGRHSSTAFNGMDQDKTKRPRKDDDDV